MLVCAAAGLLLGGCGSDRSSAQRRSLCLPAGRALVAGAASSAGRAVSTRVSTANNGYRQCTYAARLPSGRRLRLTVNVDTGAQPYFVVERAAVEAAQQFASVREFKPPQSVDGLGLEADWFPEGTYLLATDGRRLITATVSWPHARQAAQLALAERVTRHYLGRLHHNPAAGY